MFKFSDLISKWTISKDCTQEMANNIKHWVKNTGPEVIPSKKNNPIKEPKK